MFFCFFTFLLFIVAAYVGATVDVARDDSVGSEEGEGRLNILYYLDLFGEGAIAPGIHVCYVFVMFFTMFVIIQVMLQI